MVEVARRHSRREHVFDEREVVRVVRPIARVAKDLGINPGTLAKWVSKDRRGQGDGALSESEREELKRLRRENAELAMERDDDAPMFVKLRRLGGSVVAWVW